MEKIATDDYSMNRREFIAGAMAFGAFNALPAEADGAPGRKRPVGVREKSRQIRAVMLILGSGMWGNENFHDHQSPVDREGWKHLTALAAEKRANMLLLDIGEMLRWPSHPELAYPESWSVEEMRAEIQRLKAMGLEVIPKLNFSTTHNWWLGEWRRYCSTSKYYQVCEELIRDAADVFDHPRFCHIGFEEETAANQSGAQQVIVRGGDLWYHDLAEHAKSCEKVGMRPWMWSDRGWNDEEFVRRCPKSIVQSDRYDNEDLQVFDVKKVNSDFARRLALMDKLSVAGFDQIPCGSNRKSPQGKASGVKSNRSFLKLADYAKEHIAPEHHLGMMMATRAKPTKAEYKDNYEGIEILGELA